jgi:TRAP-type C4-dicarboxylate transport system substrate-binding protein
MSKRILALTVTIAALIGGPSAASAQEIQQRTIRFGHLNAAGHPMRLGALKPRPV